MYIGSSSAVDFDLQAGHLLPMARENPRGSFWALLASITNTTFFAEDKYFPTLKIKEDVRHTCLPRGIIKTQMVNEAFLSKHSFQQSGEYTLPITTGEVQRTEQKQVKKYQTLQTEHGHPVLK